MKSVVLKAVNAKGGPADPEVFVSAGGGNPKSFKFNKESDYQCSIPTKITYMDKMQGERTSVENYAQFLLDTYTDERHGFHFEVVKEEVAPTVVEKPRKKKETKNEEVAV